MYFERIADSQYTKLLLLYPGMFRTTCVGNPKSIFPGSFIFIMILKRSAFQLFFFCWAGSLFAAQPAVDTLLFTISLNDDTTSLYGCQWNDKVRSTLAGPVLMAGKHLLFYSQNGYVLYDERGKLLDSHSLLRENRKAAQKGKKPMYLAYPLDSVTIIYYRKGGDEASDEIFEKRIFKKKLKKINQKTYEIYDQITRGHLFNLTANSITDEMGMRTFLVPLLVGYTALEGGTRWWTTDRLYAFTSPLIVEDQGTCTSFFPGLKSDQTAEVSAHRIEPLGVYRMQGRWFYVGIASSLGNTDDAYYQMLVLCDQAGNLLYNSKLIKQEISESLLQYVKKTNTNYTVRRAVRHVFVPAIDRRGDICFGMIDYEEKQIRVFKRMFLRYYSKPTTEIGAQLFKNTSQLNIVPILMDCMEGNRKGVIPEITRLTDEGLKKLNRSSLVKEGYYVTVHRVEDQKLKTKLSRTQEGLPKKIQKAQERIAKEFSAWCPYSIALNHEEKGRLSFLHYGYRDEVISARLLAVTDTKRIFIRVDCESWAEVVEFDEDGSFVNRFVFNEEDYRERKDLVVAGKNGSMAEKDYEENDTPTYIEWRLESAVSHARHK